MTDINTAFHFTSIDLEANQKGLLNADQQERIQSMVRLRTKSRKWFFWTLSITFLILTLPLALSLGFEKIRHVSTEVLWAYGGVAFFLFAVYSLSVGVEKNRGRELEQGRIRFVEGALSLHKKHFARAGLAYYATVGRIRFQLENKSQWQALTKVRSCRLFYVKNPPTHFILSLDNIQS